MVTKSSAVQQPGKLTERLGKFVRSVWSEMKKVHWPARQELTTYTGVVLVSVLVVTLVLWVLDSLFSFLLGFILA